MMRKLIYLLFVPLCCISVKAQNLVPNGSFEKHYEIDTTNNFIQISDCKYWVSPTGGTPDYFSATLVDSNSYYYLPDNSCGYQNAKDGNCYSGIFIFNKLNPQSIEYLQTPLVSELLPQKKYCISFYVSLAENFDWYTVNNIGAYLSVNSITTFQNVRLDNYIPQITNPSTNPLTSVTDWMLVSGDYFAQGGERYLTIGNFNKPENQDTIPVGTGFSWDSEKRGYMYIDSVSVVLCSEVGIAEVEAGQIKVYPNPASATAFIELPNTIKNATGILMNSNGMQLQTFNLTNSVNQLSLSSYPNGIYIIHILDVNGNPIETKRIALIR